MNASRRSAREAQLPDTAGEHYKSVSAVVRRFKWVFLLLALLTAVFAFTARREYLTFENLQYLWRDLSVAADRADAFSSIVYEEQQSMAFASFRGEFVVAGSDGVRMYDGSGTTVLRENVSYASPVLRSGDRYLLMYNADEAEYSLFSTLACVHQGTALGRIQCADVSDSGSYVIVSQSTDAKYAVTYYKSNFREAARYPRESYPIDIAFSSSGDRFVFVETNSSGLSLSSQIVFCKAGTDELTAVSLGTLLPLRVQYMTNGHVAVICDEAVVYFDPDGRRLVQFDYPSVTLSCFDSSELYVTLVCSENVIGTTEHVWILNEYGDILKDEISDLRTLHIKAGTGDTFAYLVSSGTVRMMDAEQTASMSYRGHVLAVQEIRGTPLLCMSGGITAIEPDQENRDE